MHHAKKAWIGEIVVVTFVLAALVLRGHIVGNREMAETMARGIATPLTWPTIMLYGVIFFAVGWGIQLAFQLIRLHRNRRTTALSAEDEAIEFGDLGFEHHKIPYPPLPVVLGILLALAYVFAIPWLGFTLSTLSFLVLWFIVGGIRSPVKIGLVSIIGVIIILYIFVKLALMPLDRGVGVLGDFTVALFRILGIY